MPQVTEQEHKRRPVPAAAKGSARRRRVDGGRPHKIKIGFTDDEFTAIIARAKSAHVSVQRYLADAALNRRPAVSASLITELQGLRRLVLNVANNINQIARHLNSGGRPSASIDAAIDAVCRTLGELDSALGWLGAPPPPRKAVASAGGQPGTVNRPDRPAMPFRPSGPRSGSVPRLFRPPSPRTDHPDETAEDGGP